MRLTRLAICLVGLVGLYACSSDDITTTTLPANASVRFINALTDTGSVDIRMVDQVEFSAVANNLPFRGGTAYQPTEVNAGRHIRVFPSSTNILVTQQIIADTTITLTAGQRVTLLLTGSARAKTVKFITIVDNIDAPASGQIGVRLVNASSGTVNGYLVNAVGDAITGTPAFSNVASLSTSAYVGRTAGNAAVRATDVGSTTPNASTAGPTAAASLPGDVFPASGVNTAGTKFSVYYFPRGVAGSPQNGVTTASLVWFVDRNPCDAGSSC
jgi:hypothetical protein